jgi:outer membrane protein
MLTGRQPFDAGLAQPPFSARFLIRARRADLQSIPLLLLRIVVYLIVFVLLVCAGSAFAQTPPALPDHPWHGAGEQKTEADSRGFRESRFTIDLTRAYTLAELVDLAESNNPETRVAWERARSQAGALGIARSELYPTIASAAAAGVHRDEVYLNKNFVRQTIGHYQEALHLNYTVFDFGARAGRIDAAKAELLASNFAFNDTHRRVIYQVERAYYQLLNASGQEDSARASLANAQAVQEAAEERLKNGLATLPDVLEARSATAQAQYDLQAVLGQELIAQGDLATALGASATLTVRVQPLDQLTIPDSIDETAEQAIDRALAQRPDLMQQVAEVRSANARVKEARAAYYPTLNFIVEPTAESFYAQQQQLPWGHTADLVGGVGFRLNWTVFDGGTRKNRVAQTQADARAAQAEAHVIGDQIADQVWAAYSNLSTAFRQRMAATALLEAASRSYEAALESYNYGLRNELDVTAAQQTLARARSTDVLARTQVLASLADLAFRTADSVQPNAKRP